MLISVFGPKLEVQIESERGKKKKPPQREVKEPLRSWLASWWQEEE